MMKTIGSDPYEECAIGKPILMDYIIRMRRAIEEWMKHAPRMRDAMIAEYDTCIAELPSWKVALVVFERWIDLQTEPSGEVHFWLYASFKEMIKMEWTENAKKPDEPTNRRRDTEDVRKACHDEDERARGVAGQRSQVTQQEKQEFAKLMLASEKNESRTGRWRVMNIAHQMPDTMQRLASSRHLNHIRSRIEAAGCNMLPAWAN